jgi:hypothetical protein
VTLDSLIAESGKPDPQLPVAPPVREDAETVTPNGIKVEFQTKPYRRYFVNGKQVVSVTQVLGCIDKPALKWWGMKIGVGGCIELVRRGVTAAATLESADPESIVALLTQEKLTVNHVRKEAADRGTRVHDALERWAKTNVLPDPEDVRRSRTRLRGGAAGVHP